MLKTRLLIYVRGGVIQQIETPDDPDSLTVLIEDHDDEVTYNAGIATCDEEDWDEYLGAVESKGRPLYE